MAKAPQKRHQRKAWVDRFRTGHLVPFTRQKELISLQHIGRRALVRGLLLYFSEPTRRMNADNYAGDWLEDGLLEFVDQVLARKTSTRIDGHFQEHKQYASRKQNKKHTIGETQEEITRIAHAVSAVMKDLLRHPHRLTLDRESDWLTLKALKKAPIHNHERCQVWLRNNLPLLLRRLNALSRCGFLYCPRTTTVPASSELMRWTSTARGVGALRFHILAHFHGSTYDTVKRSFSSRVT